MLVFKPCKKFLPPKIFTTTTTNSKLHLLHLLHLHHHHHRHVKLHFPPLKAHFKSTLSSSPLSPPPPSDSSPLAADSASLTITTTTTTTTTTVDFLMDSGGLSYVQAIQVIRKKPTLLQDGGIKPRLVIAYFESIGFSKTHISKIISKSPSVLVSDVEKTLKPKIQLFQDDFGFPDSDIADLIALQPSILHRRVKTHMKPALDFIKSFVKTNEVLIKAIKRNDHLLLRSSHYRKSMEANIHVLRHHGVPDSEIVNLIVLKGTTLMSTTPGVFKSIVERIVTLGFKPETRKFSTAVVAMCGMNKATWDSKVDLLKSLGWSDVQILDAFRRYPSFLMLSRENLNESIGFFMESLNWDASVLSQRPSILEYSLKVRVIPRFAVLKCLMSKQIIKQDKQLKYMLSLNETHFLSKYVFKYQEQLPYLYEVYNKECIYAGTRG